MLHTLLNVFYVLIAIAMIVFILLQRGAGAQAGSGFGAGASGTVFGARGSANFLSSATKWLAVLFFGLSLFMAWQASRVAKGPGEAAPSIMTDLPADAGAKPAPPSPLAPAPATPVGTAPAATPVIAPATVPATTPAAVPPGTGTTTAPEPAATSPAPPRTGG